VKGEKMQRDPEIMSVGKMLEEITLMIPDYQRPYKWGEKNIRDLVNDIKRSKSNGKMEYRIGTIILHYDDAKKMHNIVDGQQRLISLTILLYAFGANEKYLSLLKREITFSKDEQKRIKENYKTILKLLERYSIATQEYTDYVLNCCKFVMIFATTEQEAFQFFDSQNSRGKPLYPHDLLKAYHLREMNKEDNKKKEEIINTWENIEKKRDGEVSLADLLEYYIYPIRQWIKLKDGLGKKRKIGNLNFDSKKIDTFKGIKKVDSPCQSCDKNIFQLNQEIIAGKSFFLFVERYHGLLKEIQDIIKKHRSVELSIEKRLPNVKNEYYVKRLYEAALLLYVDRFYDKPEEREYAIKHLFRWAYRLRMKHDRVGELSINIYAKETTRMFQKISEAVDPDDIFFMELPPLEYSGNENAYHELYDYLNSKE
jgi:hypothetical protein